MTLFKKHIYTDHGTAELIKHKEKENFMDWSKRLVTVLCTIVLCGITLNLHYLPQEGTHEWNFYPSP